MIQLPRRSVTRFFIPLIDVLTLLFCIYLLLPIVQPPAESSPAEENINGDSSAGPPDKNERKELNRLRQENRLLRKTGKLTDTERSILEQFRTDKIEILQNRLAIRVLEIDADTGKLFYNDPERVEITSESNARAVIEKQKKEVPGRELYYLFLFPRTLTGYPLERQMRQYEKWFSGVARGIDSPGFRRS
ncbi:MAG TPA: hypothetical protein VGY77_12310 [Gemmataceae bacterium]|nr:hypothetical protein [Gemmataceae bacterium]